MHIPTWRLALTGVAIVVLLAVGIGFVAASSSPANHPATAAAAPTANPAASGAPHGKGTGVNRFLEKARRFGFGGRLVHVTATVLDKDGNLIQLQLDHGTVQATGNGSITVAEAGGATVTVSTDTSTIVRVGREKGTLADLKVGDQVFVQSRIDGATTLAKHILEVTASN